MFYRTASMPAQQQPALRQQAKNVASWSRLAVPAAQAARTPSPLLPAFAPSTPASWNNSANRSAAILGLARAGSLLAMSCLASEEALAASYQTEDNAGTVSSAASLSSASSSSSSTSTLTQDSTDNDKLPSTTHLNLSAGAFVLPHPDKMQKGGEDWYFIANNRRALGVADGVGGWAEIGVDAGAYARQLMNAAQDVAEAVTAEPETASARLDAQIILEKAYTCTTVRGSSTACVATLNGETLLVSNLGDSGLLVMRGGKVAFHTPQQQHDFNFPFQIGSQDSMSDAPSSAQRFEVAVQPGDVVVLGTDGLWDNCFDEEVASVLKYCNEQRMEPPKMAQVLAHYARHRASDSKFASPFAYAAFQAGFAYMGGKMDDITVVIALVTQAAKL